MVCKFGEELQLLQLAFRFWLGISLGYGLYFFLSLLVILSWCASVGERCDTLVGYWISAVSTCVYQMSYGALYYTALSRLSGPTSLSGG